MINKISAYVGFAMKANQIVIGTDNVLSKRDVKIVLLNENLSENAKRKISKKCKVYTFTDAEFGLISKDASIKVIGIIDNNLSNAIRNLLEVQ